MSRLTERDNLGCVIHGDAIYSDWDVPEGFRGEAIEYLAALEDILYAPDGTELITLDRLRELVEADRDGRCVVLPCKVRDTIYAVQKRPISGAFEIKPYYVTEFSTRGREVCLQVAGVNLGSNGCFCRASDFGKTVFLTRAEAEDALEGRG